MDGPGSVKQLNSVGGIMVSVSSGSEGGSVVGSVVTVTTFTHSRHFFYNRRDMRKVKVVLLPRLTTNCQFEVVRLASLTSVGSLKHSPSLGTGSTVRNLALFHSLAPFFAVCYFLASSKAVLDAALHVKYF